MIKRKTPKNTRSVLGGVQSIPQIEFDYLRCLILYRALIFFFSNIIIYCNTICSFGQESCNSTDWYLLVFPKLLGFKSPFPCNYWNRNTICPFGTGTMLLFCLWSTYFVCLLVYLVNCPLLSFNIYGKYKKVGIYLADFSCMYRELFTLVKCYLCYQAITSIQPMNSSLIVTSSTYKC